MVLVFLKRCDGCDLGEQLPLEERCVYVRELIAHYESERFPPLLNKGVGCLIPCQGIQGVAQGVMRTFSRWSCLDRCEEPGSCSTPGDWQCF